MTEGYNYYDEPIFIDGEGWLAWIFFFWILIPFYAVKGLIRLIKEELKK